MPTPAPAERPALLSWQLLEGGEVLATFALADGRRAQLLVSDQQLSMDVILEMAALAGALAPRPGPALLDVAGRREE